ncbi:MAG: hypothetical protein V2J14_11580, partial [Erythrobacter sp.]|nr:hypothetical protein [Erythrobacter sp.]
MSSRVMALIHLVFSNRRNADLLVAGVPAAARAVHWVEREGRAAQAVVLVLECEGDPEPVGWTCSETARLAPGVAVDWRGRGDAQIGGGDTALDGERLAAGRELRLAPDIAAIAAHKAAIPPGEEEAALRDAGRAIIAATGKASDGLVSRYINRPISRFVTRQALRIPGVTPLHGTLAALVIGIAMAGFLFLGGPAGVVAGAVLFQAASVIDG